MTVGQALSMDDNDNIIDKLKAQYIYSSSPLLPGSGVEPAGSLSEAAEPLLAPSTGTRASN